MFSLRQRVASYLSSAAQPAGSHWMSEEFQIAESRVPFGFSQYAPHSSLRWSVDLKHYFPERSLIRGRRESFGPFPHRAHSRRHALSSLHAPSWRRFVSLVFPEVQPRFRRVVLDPRAPSAG